MKFDTPGQKPKKPDTEDQAIFLPVLPLEISPEKPKEEIEVTTEPSKEEPAEETPVTVVEIDETDTIEDKGD